MLITLGIMFAQLFGNVLFEEFFYRGYLFSQFSHRFYQKYPKKPTLAVHLGMICSNLLFAVLHIPNRIANGFSVGETVLSIIFLFIIGYFFNIIYLVSDNLLVAMVFHYFWNIGIGFIVPVLDNYILMVIFGVIFCIIVLILRKKRMLKAPS